MPDFLSEKTKKNNNFMGNIFPAIGKKGKFIFSPSDF